MKRLILLVLTGMMLGGCSVGTNAPAANILPEQTYQGYPCFETCEAFEKGFKHARNGGIKTEDGCHMSNINERSGCKAYVAEAEWQAHEQSDLFIK